MTRSRDITQAPFRGEMHEMFRGMRIRKMNRKRFRRLSNLKPRKQKRPMASLAVTFLRKRYWQRRYAPSFPKGLTIFLARSQRKCQQFRKNYLVIRKPIISKLQAARLETRTIVFKAPLLENALQQWCKVNRVGVRIERHPYFPRATFDDSETAMLAFLAFR